MGTARDAVRLERHGLTDLIIIFPKKYCTQFVFSRVNWPIANRSIPPVIYKPRVSDPEEDLEATMSRASKLTLLGTSLLTVCTVVGVHFQQKFEQAVRFPLLN